MLRLWAVKVIKFSSLATLRKSEEFLTPYCHAKMPVLVKTSQKLDPPPPLTLAAQRHL